MQQLYRSIFAVTQVTEESHHLARQRRRRALGRREMGGQKHETGHPARRQSEHGACKGGRRVQVEQRRVLVVDGKSEARGVRHNRGPHWNGKKILALLQS